jgi:hypothetical protein
VISAANVAQDPGRLESDVRWERPIPSIRVRTDPAAQAALKRKLLVCTTDRRARLGDVEVLPIRDFLAELPP